MNTFLAECMHHRLEDMGHIQLHWTYQAIFLYKDRLLVHYVQCWVGEIGCHLFLSARDMCQRLGRELGFERSHNFSLT